MHLAILNFTTITLNLLRSPVGFRLVVKCLLTANEDDPVAPSETEIDDRIFESNYERLTWYHDPVEEIGEQHQTARQNHSVSAVARYNDEQNIHQDPRSE